MMQNWHGPLSERRSRWFRTTVLVSLASAAVATGVGLGLTLRWWMAGILGFGVGCVIGWQMLRNFDRRERAVTPR
jgi:hypothetical protein